MSTGPIDPDQSDALWDVLAALPRADAPIPQALRAALHARVLAGNLRADVIEPSVALGRESFRLIVNPGPRPRNGGDRVGRTLDLMGCFSLADPLGDVAARWLGDTAHELFLGVAVEDEQARFKVYLRTSRSDDAALAAAWDDLAGFRPAPIGHMLAIDVADGAPVAYKQYGTVPHGEAESIHGGGTLLPGLGGWLGDAEDARFYLCRRFAPGGALRDESLHVQLGASASPTADLSYCRAVGDAPSEERLASLRSIAKVEVRVLSETRASSGGRCAYLAITP